MNVENVILYSTKASVSESPDKSDVYICKFILCDFGVNENGVALNRDTIAEWMGSIKNKPVVGKIQVRYGSGEEDFSDHAVKLVEKIDEDGTPYTDMVFDSDAFGTFTDVAIENINGIDYLVATAEIWKRFERACSIILKRIERGDLKTSWEIKVTDSFTKLVDSTVVKIINTGRFLGHALLGETTSPAYPASRLLNIAQENYDEDLELTKALTEDILFSKKIENALSDAHLTETLPNLNPAIEKLQADLSVRDKTIIALNSKIQELTSEISALIPFKEEFEQAKKKRLEQETIAKKKLLKDNLIKTTKMSLKEIEASDEIMSIIDALDEVKLNSFIVNRIVSLYNSEIATVETSSKKEMPVKRESLESAAPIDYKSIMKSFLGKI